MLRTSLALSVVWLCAGCRFTVSVVDVSDASAAADDLALGSDAFIPADAALDAEPGDAALDAEPGDAAVELDLSTIDLRSVDLTPPVCASSCTSCALGCCGENFSSGDHTVTCQSGCSCSVMSSAHDVTVNCPAVSTCSVTTHIAHDTSVVCGAGSSCSFDCTNAHNCNLSCGAGSSCLIHCNLTFSCNLTGCTPVDCGNGVHVCGRGCP